MECLTASNCNGPDVTRAAACTKTVQRKLLLCGFCTSRCFGFVRPQCTRGLEEGVGESKGQGNVKASKLLYDCTMWDMWVVL